MTHELPHLSPGDQRHGQAGVCCSSAGTARLAEHSSGAHRATAASEGVTQTLSASREKLCPLHPPQLGELGQVPLRSHLQNGTNGSTDFSEVL